MFRKSVSTIRFSYLSIKDETSRLQIVRSLEQNVQLFSYLEAFRKLNEVVLKQGRMLDRSRDSLDEVNAIAVILGGFNPDDKGVQRP